MPTRSHRATAAAGIAVLAALFVIRLASVMPHYGTDFDPIRAAARVALHGDDPYALIGPDRPISWNYHVRYPMTAIALGIPFVAVPLVAARALFVGLTSGLLAYVITCRAWWPMLIFASASWWSAVGLAQWSPVMLAAMFAPWLGFVLVAKPNIGLAVLTTVSTRRALIITIIGCTIITVIAFALMPRWVPAWLDVARDTPDVTALALTMLGWPLLLAAFKWRRPEARLLLALAAIPINPALYEGVLLFAVPRTAKQALILATLSWFVDPLTSMWERPGAAYFENTAIVGRAMMLCMYLPALVMVLRRPSQDGLAEPVGK